MTSFYPLFHNILPFWYWMLSDGEDFQNFLWWSNIKKANAMRTWMVWYIRWYDTFDIKEESVLASSSFITKYRYIMARKTSQQFLVIKDHTELFTEMYRNDSVCSQNWKVLSLYLWLRFTSLLSSCCCISFVRPL